MKAICFALCAGALLAASPASAANFTSYLVQASARASARLAEKGVAINAPIRVKVRIDSDGELQRLGIAESSGSVQIDDQVRKALRFAHVGAPPTALLDREVVLLLDPSGHKANAR